MHIFFFLLLTFSFVVFPLTAADYHFFLDRRKIYFLSKKTYYKGRVHVDFSTNFSGNERQFCEDFDQGKLKPVQTMGLLGAVNNQSFFSPMQCGDGDPKIPLTQQLKREAVFERIALMCDENQVPNCIRYAANSQWAKTRWIDSNQIQRQIKEIFSQGMEVRVRDFLNVGGNLRASNDTIPCLLFRNEMCGDLYTPPKSSQYSNAGEEWYMTQAINCDAHQISTCLFNALYSNWAKKWPSILERKKALFQPLKKAREKRVNDIVEQQKKARKIKLF